MLAASASVPLLQQRGCAALAATSPKLSAQGYGSDPDLTKNYCPGDLWPLRFTRAQRRTAGVLCDVIIPADSMSPSASAVGVVDFIAEWVSAPYPLQQHDRRVILAGLAWLNAESGHRFAKEFAVLSADQQRAICDDICSEKEAQPRFRRAAQFFAIYRNLTAGGFYSTPAGRKDLQYIGNVALATFEGPPNELLQKLGLGHEHV